MHNFAVFMDSADYTQLGMIYMGIYSFCATLYICCQQLTEPLLGFSVSFKNTTISLNSWLGVVIFACILIDCWCVNMSSARCEQLPATCSADDTASSEAFMARLGLRHWRLSQHCLRVSQSFSFHWVSAGAVPSASRRRHRYTRPCRICTCLQLPLVLIASVHRGWQAEWLAAYGKGFPSTHTHKKLAIVVLTGPYVEQLYWAKPVCQTHPSHRVTDWD